jgi:hypothetical protein
VHACCQLYNTSPQGEALVLSYRIERLPMCFIVDPITGAQLWKQPGFVSAEALTEELVPFMDAGWCACGCGEGAAGAARADVARRRGATA